MVVWIVGAYHRIQWIPKWSGSEWSSKIAEFSRYVKEQCKDHNIQLIAEELSQSNVQTSDAQDSLSKIAAEDLGISHSFCDPDENEREALNIQSDADRENEWLRRLRASGSQQILFICGDAHADTFAKRIVDAGFTAQVISRNWGRGWETID